MNRGIRERGISNPPISHSRVTVEARVSPTKGGKGFDKVLVQKDELRGPILASPPGAGNEMGGSQAVGSVRARFP